MYHTKAQNVKILGFFISMPLGGESDDICLGDIIPYPDGQNSMEAIDNSIWWKQLHDALERVLEGIPSEQVKVLRMRHYKGRTVAATAQELGISYSEARQLEERGIRALRQPKIAKKLRSFYDFH